MNFTVRGTPPEEGPQRQFGFSFSFI
jgi:hypothetical protein